MWWNPPALYHDLVLMLAEGGCPTLISVGEWHLSRGRWYNTQVLRATSSGTTQFGGLGRALLEAVMISDGG